MNNKNNRKKDQLEFILTTVNPKTLKLHSLLSKMGCDNKSDEYFKAEKENLGCKFERPIIDTDNNVLTHSADVLYAQQNGDDSIEVFVVELNDIQRKRLITHKNRYNQTNLAASYETSIFFKNYLTESEEGKLFAESLPGKSTREKVAGLLNTSDSSIKRLWYVGDNLPEEFGLISENNSSLKEAEEKIKLMKWRQKQNEVKSAAQAQQNNSEDNSKSNELLNDSEKDEGVIMPILTVTEKPTPNNSVPIIIDKPGTNTEQKEDECYFGADSIDEPEQPCQNATATSYSFSKGYIEIEGMGRFAVNVTNNTAELSINGNLVNNVQYTPMANLDPLKFANVNSFIFQEPKHKGLNVQIIITNYSHK